MIKLNPGKTVVCDSFTLSDKYGKSVENVMRHLPSDRVLMIEKDGERYTATICTSVGEIKKEIVNITRVEKILPKKIIKSKKKGKKHGFTKKI